MVPFSTPQPSTWVNVMPPTWFSLSVFFNTENLDISQMISILDNAAISDLLPTVFRHAISGFSQRFSFTPIPSSFALLYTLQPQATSSTGIPPTE